MIVYFLFNIKNCCLIYILLKINFKQCRDEDKKDELLNNLNYLNL